MTRSTPLKILGWSLAALLALIAIVVIFVLTFDWNRARPYINEKVSESTGRSFVIGGDLQVKWQQGRKTEPGWRRYVPRPVISAQDVRMSNPDWATAGPQLASAKRIDVAIHPLPLLQHRVVLTDLALEAPNIALQRRADGSNSWTLKDNGPSAWDVEIQRMAFGDGAIRYLDEGIALDVHAKVSSTAPDATPGDAPGNAPMQKYGIAFTLGGSYRKAPVTGGGKAGAVLSLTDNNTVYPVQAHAVLGKNKASIDGTLTDPRSLSGIDLQLSLAGASMADLYPLTGVLLPETPHYSTEGHLTGTLAPRGGEWVYDKFSGKVGSSDISGKLAFSASTPRKRLTGEVHSRLLQFSDLGPLVGADSSASKKERGVASTQPAGRVLPVETFKTERWTSLDADVRYTADKITRDADLPISKLDTHVVLTDGVLSLTPLNFNVAGGTLTSQIKLDGSGKVIANGIAAELKASARHLRIQQLFPRLPALHASAGEINGDASLSATGNSVASLLGSSNGEVRALIERGSISKLLLEEMGLNIGSVVLTKLVGDKQVKLNCMAADFVAIKGLMRTRQFIVDTDDAILHVDGTVNLADERLDLTLQPDSKGLRVFSLRSPLYVRGTFSKPDVSVDKGVLALRAGGALALAVVAPVAALLPLVNTGPGEDSACAALLAEARVKPVAPKPGKTPRKTW